MRRWIWIVVVPVAVMAGLAVLARPSAATPVVGFAVGSFHGCQLVGTQVRCWGFGNQGQLGDGGSTSRTGRVGVDASGVLGGVSITRLAAGGNHTCALSSTGAAYCWGYNVAGQLGDGSTTDATVPVAVDMTGALNGLNLSRISAGYRHTCGLSSAGAAYCWGGNASGQLGDGGTTDASVPVAVSISGVLSGVQLSDIAAGYDHTCALSTTGTVYCWGADDHGQLGDGGASTATSPVAVSTTGALSGEVVTALASGADNTCVLAGGAPFCWGRNNSGQLGDGGTTESNTPVAVVTSGVLNGVTLARISTGGAHTCVLSSTGVAYCWGWNGYGQLGDGTTTDATAPVAVDATGALNGVTLATVGAGDGHTCAGTASGADYCWGYNGYSQLGDGTNVFNRTTPVAVVELATAPGAPQHVTVSPGNTAIEASWDQPTTFGSGTFTSYTAYAYPPASVTAAGSCATTSPTATGCTIRHLSNGTIYTVRVRATTDVGSSALGAASAPVTPGAPGAPHTVPTSDGSITSSAGTALAATGTTQITGTGFAPNTPVRIVLYSTPVTLASTVSNSSGAISVRVTISGGYQGPHTLVALGEGPAGRVLAMTLPVTVAPSDLTDTGTHVLDTIQLGVGLLGSGAILLTAVRRRRI